LDLPRLALAAALLLSACRVGQLPTPAPPTPVAPALNAPPTSGPPPSPEITPTLRADHFPPRPTATAYEPITSAPQTFVNAEYGVSVRYPDGWTTGPDDSNPAILAWFYSPREDVFAALFVSDFDPDQSLQAAAADLREASLGVLDDLQILSDEAITLDDGRQAWRSVATGQRADGSLVKASLVTTVGAGWTLNLLVFGDPPDYDANLDDSTALVGALRVAPASLYGIPRDQALVLLGGESRNPREHDPATRHSNGDTLVFSGLVAFGPNMALVPDLAETWQAAGGVVYTFTLRADARFHNGRPVTAQDVIYSWERAADPETNSDTVLTYLGDIVGVRERRAGRADHISGLKAVDDHTLVVTIDAPKPYFLLKLTYAVAFVVDRENVESGPEWWRTPNGTGPYRLIRWEPLELKLYERNDDYYGEAPPFPYVIVRLYSGVGIRLYETDEIDVTGVSYYDVPRVRDPHDPLHADLIEAVSLCTSYVVFDAAQPPFDDVRVRRAFALAFDRQKYIDVVLRGIALPARGLYPPAMPGHNLNLRGLPYDPERARRLLAESKYGGPEGLPPIVYTDGGTGSDVGGDVGALAQMWRQHLGVTITVENLEPDKYYDEISAGHHGQIFSGGWCADYPDPENFADALFHTGAQENRGNYSNPGLDALLDKARVEPDVSRRLALYQQAEQIIVDDAPVIFTVHGLSFTLIKPHVRDRLCQSSTAAFADLCDRVP
jgi:ABC-type transport system substrate-binding protein